MVGRGAWGIGFSGEWSVLAFKCGKGVSCSCFFLVSRFSEILSILMDGCVF